MKKAILTLILILTTFPFTIFAAEKPRVEVAFVLDTTSSMCGLIEGAKKKIWFIANQIVACEPRPEVRMALVPYRDKGDAYVTKVFDLTDNIDQVYNDLMGFKAEGGGDTPENVNQGLHDAVEKLSWSKDHKTLKIIYLVGDCPPHNEYKDVPTYDKIAASALNKDININTILCGGHAQAMQVWKRIAQLAEGQYMAISQDGGVTDIQSPYDKELARLNTELTRNMIPFGAKERRRKAEKLNLCMEAMEAKAPASAAADRACFVASWESVDDLVAAVQNKKADLKNIPSDQLPEKMQKMNAKEREEHINSAIKKREEITKKIKELSKKRSDFLRKEMEKNKGARDGFDAQVIETLKTQAAKKDILYK